MNSLFVRHSTDAEIAQFVRVMRGGTSAEKEAAVEAATHKVIDKLTASQAKP